MAPSWGQDQTPIHNTQKSCVVFRCGLNPMAVDEAIAKVSTEKERVLWYKTAQQNNLNLKVHLPSNFALISKFTVECLQGLVKDWNVF